jgi:PAS domain S-box-containing protein
MLPTAQPECFFRRKLADQTTRLVLTITTPNPFSPELLQPQGPLHAVLEASPVALVAVDRRARIRLANAEAERLCGCSREELMTLLIGALLPPRLQEWLAGFFKTFFAQPQSQPFGSTANLCLLRKDGSEVPVEMGFSPLYLGEEAFVLAAITDLGPRRRAENEEAARSRRSRVQAETLMELLRDPGAAAGDFDSGVRRLTELAAAALETDQASVWLLDDFGKTLVCADLYTREGKTHGSEQALRREFFPAYFAAIEREKSVAVDNAQTDARVAEMVATYFLPRGIGATLDAPIRTRGDLVGVLCLEHKGGPRIWTMDERAFAGSLADQAAQLLLHVEHTKAALSARDAIERLEEIFAHTTEAIFSLRVTPAKEFIYEEFNPAASVMSGVPSIKACGRRPQDMLPPAVAAQWNGHYRRCLDEGKPLEFVENIAYAPGAGTFHTFLIPIRDASGAIHRIAGFSRDVTEQKEAERALQISEEKFSKAFRSSPDAISVSDAETGRFIEINEGFERLFACKASEVIGRSSLELDLWAMPEDRDRLLLELRAGGSVKNFAATARPRSGPLRPCVLAAETAKIGGRQCLVLVIRDVTEQRAAEQAQEELESQLRQAQKLEALGQLAGGIAHDFNNIITAIMAYAELAVMDLARPDDVREHLDQVQKASNRARDLVRRILTFSRQRKQERRPVQLAAVIEEAVNLVRSTLPATIEIVVRAAPDAPVVLADLSQIHQVMMNLCTNSAYAMRDRPGRLTISLERVQVDAALVRGQPELREGVYARLTVSDTGSGMAPGILKRVFEPFFTTKGPGEGTGLGLSVVHGIMQDHEGAVTLESEPRCGTTFRLYFPEQIGVEDMLPSAGQTLVRGRGERILFIDDEQALCESTRLLLDKIGYKTTAFTSPVAALERFREDPDGFDLIVTDLSMPFMTGVDVGKEMLTVRPQLPVILASGFSGTWTVEKVRAQGLRDLLIKPLTGAALSATIRRTLDEKDPRTRR